MNNWPCKLINGEHRVCLTDKKVLHKAVRIYPNNTVKEWFGVTDSKSGGPRFKSRSNRCKGLFLGSPELNFSVGLVNSQLACLLPVGIFFLFVCEVYTQLHQHLCYKHCR